MQRRRDLSCEADKKLEVVHVSVCVIKNCSNSYQYQSSSGNICMCPATGNLLINNMTDGFDLYAANRPAPIRSFPVRSTKKYVKGGIFAEGGRAVVCG